MGRLRGCQGSLLKRSCGASAATALNELFDIVLRDPHYLRFDYRPDCYLHGAESASPPPPPDSVPRPESPVVPHASPGGRIPAQGSGDRDGTSDLPSASGDRYQAQGSRNAAPGHQRAPIELVSVAPFLVVAAVHLR